MAGRRLFLGHCFSVAAACIGPGKLLAAQLCQPSGLGPICSSYIPIQLLAKVYAHQQMSEWCWAACISMIFGFNEHPVSQIRIVNDAYGGVANIPGNYPAMLGSLNREWTDDSGSDFTVSVNSLFAPELGATSLTNAELVSALEHEQPVLFCTLQHAMVLTSMSYIGGNVLEAWVMDPWPGRGLRRLLPAELMPITLGGALRMAATLDLS